MNNTKWYSGYDANHQNVLWPTQQIPKYEKPLPHSKFMLRLIAFAGYLELETNR